MKTEFKPNYKKLNEYLKNGSVIPGYFKNHLSNCKNHCNYKNFKDIIKKYKLERSEDDMTFFLVWYYTSLDFTTWASEINLSIINRQGAKDRIKLNDFIGTLNSTLKYGKTHSEHLKMPSIEKISFTCRNPKRTVTINSYMICLEIIELIEERIKEYPPGKVPSAKDKRRYKLEFVQRLHPFFLYLKNETNFKNKSANFVYEFIEVFIDTIKEDFVSATYLKDYINSTVA